MIIIRRRIHVKIMININNYDNKDDNINNNNDNINNSNNNTEL